MHIHFAQFGHSAFRTSQHWPLYFWRHKCIAGLYDQHQDRHLDSNCRRRTFKESSPMFLKSRLCCSRSSSARRSLCICSSSSDSSTRCSRLDASHACVACAWRQSSRVGRWTARCMPSSCDNSLMIWKLVSSYGSSYTTYYYWLLPRLPLLLRRLLFTIRKLRSTTI